jgi:RNA-directed DNA polymerase
VQKGGFVKDEPSENNLDRVPCQGAKPTGETESRWDWVEPNVWTERMLTTLEHGVKGGKWYSLIDKVYNPKNLETAFLRVKRNQGGAGVDHQTVHHYEQNLDHNLRTLQGELRQGDYRPQAIRRVWIPKPGQREKRPLGIPTVRDRIVQTALRQVIEPIYEQGFASSSYGFRPGRGCKDALRRVDQLLKLGYVWVVDADITKFFDTIDLEILMQEIQKRIADQHVLQLIEAYLQQQVMDSGKRWTPEEGTPQGAVISPLLANIYLNPLDHQMIQAKYEMVRYADDLVILCRTESEARQALQSLEKWCLGVKLKLHPEKTRLVHWEQPGGFDFLGYHFEQGKLWPSRKSLRKFKQTIREKTKRTNGTEMKQIIQAINRLSQGWFEYFKHCRKSTFSALDRIIRRRLRTILRKRSKRKGFGYGFDQRRWPNKLFTEMGFFSLEKAHQQACQSSRR